LDSDMVQFGMIRIIGAGYRRKGRKTYEQKNKIF